MIPRHSIERTYQKRDVHDAFFPVVEAPLKYVFGGEVRDVAGYKAIVDITRKRALSTVSSHYTLVTNADVYDLLGPVAKGFFGGKGMEDFECFNLHMPQSRASCRIDLTRANPSAHLFHAAGGDPWTAFIRIANSYNRTTRLEIQIGYCRWICLNGVIFGANSYTVSLRHDERCLANPSFRKKVVDEALIAVGDVGKAEKDFADILETLRGVPMTKEQMEMLFWRVLNVRLPDSGVGSLPPKRRERLLNIRQRLTYLMDAYCAEFPCTAYAAFNILTDFASYPHDSKPHSVLTPGYQSKVGAWLSAFIPKNEKPGYSLDDYFTPGDEATLAGVKAIEQQARRAGVTMKGAVS